MVQDLFKAETAAAAAAIVVAFASTDGDAYFAGFAPDATFLFPSDFRARTTFAEYRAAGSPAAAGGSRSAGARSGMYGCSVVRRSSRTS